MPAKPKNSGKMNRNGSSGAAAGEKQHEEVQQGCHDVIQPQWQVPVPDVFIDAEENEPHTHGGVEIGVHEGGVDAVSRAVLDDEVKEVIPLPGGNGLKFHQSPECGEPGHGDHELEHNGEQVPGEVLAVDGDIERSQQVAAGIQAAHPVAVKGRDRQLQDDEGIQPARTGLCTKGGGDPAADQEKHQDQGQRSRRKLEGQKQGGGAGQQCPFITVQGPQKA